MKDRLWQKIDGVVWIQTSFIGDITLTTTALETLRKLRPDLKQVVITTAVGAEVLADFPPIKPLAIPKRGLITFIKQMREIKNRLKKEWPGIYSRRSKIVLLQPHLSFRSSFLALYLKLPRFTFFEAKLSFFSRWRVPRVAVLHESQRIALLLTGLGVEREFFQRIPPLLKPPKVSFADYDDFFNRTKKFIAIVPGSVWATKKWPVAFYAQLASMLGQRPDIALVLLGSEREKKETKLITRSLPKEVEVLDLAGKTKISDLRDLYPKLSAVICNDSSSTHFASAFQVPTIAIFGATIPSMGFAPLAPHSNTVSIPLNCRPCSDHGPKRCPKSHFHCMKKLTVDAVYQQVQILLDKVSS